VTSNGVHVTTKQDDRPTCSNNAYYVANAVYAYFEAHFFHFHSHEVGYVLLFA
jgi:hypothetical protein